jgi:bacterial/archaeal transporter family-2 protein
VNSQRFGVVVAILVGVSIAGQSRLNGALGARLDDGVAAAVISFGSGFVLLCIGLAFSKRMQNRLAEVRTAVRTKTLAPWQCIGGVCGAFYVACQGITISTIGVAVFTVAVVGGQLLSSLLVDRAGLGPAESSPLTGNRVLGAALALIAVAVASSGRIDADASALLFAVLPAIAGIGLAWQQAVNGRVAAVGGPMVATWINFATGTTALVIVAAIGLTVRGWPSTPPTDWWLYVGGTLGIAHIAAAAVLVRTLGVLLLGLSVIAGQLLGALLLDAIVPASGATLTVTVVVGGVLTLVAVWIAAGRSKT